MYYIGIGRLGTCQSSILYVPFDSGRAITITSGREGASVSFSEAKTMFLNDFCQNNAMWFFPYLDRLIAGEKVTIEELDAKHHELFGHPMERGEFNGQSYQKCPGS